jgi:hypothetical protein
LTIVDETQFAMARVSKKIGNNEFEIMTDKPNIEVSWQVTGVRNDVYAQAHRIVPEVEKSAQEKGKFLHPELVGEPVTMKIGPPAPQIAKTNNQPAADDPSIKQSPANNKIVEETEADRANRRPGVPTAAMMEKSGAGKTVVSKDQPAKEAVKTETTAASPELKIITITPEELRAEKQEKLSAEKNKAEELKKILEQKPVVPENSKIKSDQGKIPPAETKPVETPAKLETAPAKSN